MTPLACEQFFLFVDRRTIGTIGIFAFVISYFFLAPKSGFDVLKVISFYPPPPSVNFIYPEIILEFLSDQFRYHLFLKLSKIFTGLIQSNW